MSNDRIGVLFICMGNICRSPLAEGVFIDLARERGVLERFVIDSCGTGGWHAGERADPRAREVARRNGLELTSRARKFDPRSDIDGFAHLIVMDRANRDDILDAGAPSERVRLLRAFDPELAGADEGSLDVPDPYWGGADGFDNVFAMVTRACEGLLDELSA